MRRVLERSRPGVRASLVLVGSTMLQMSVNLLRMSSGVAITSYRERAELERGALELEPMIDLGAFEKKLGR